MLTSDVVTSHAGALGRAPGVVAAIGTGAVVLAVGADGRTARVDGWGHLIGDHGSGFQIGRQGLAAALDHFDGRGGSHALATAAEERFGPLPSLAGLLFAVPNRVARVASFCRDVVDIAEQGDDVARMILADSAMQIGRSIVVAADRVADGDVPQMWSWAGSLLGHESLRLPVTAWIDEHATHLTQVTPLGSAIDGAALLASVKRRRHFADLICHRSR